MFYEIARAIVQKIFQDKILAGLVIVGFLAIFVGGFGGGGGDHKSRSARATEAPSPSSEHQSDKSAQSKQAAEQTAAKAPGQAEAANSQAATAAKIEPALATQFVSWWINNSMDYNPQTAMKNHQSAMSWISPEASPKYQAAFWPPEIADGITTGKIQGLFTPTGVKAVACNPDGTVVVNVTGNLVLQQGQRPAVQQLSTDYLVKRDVGGLRIADLYNRAVLLQGSGVY